jgi:hypothetical protein
MSNSKKTKTNAQTAASTKLATLLIYENTGSGVSMYLLSDEMEEKYKNVLDACQEKFVNSDEYTKELGILSALVQENPEYVDNEFKEHACKWAGAKLPTKTPANVLVGKIYYSGFCD